MTSRKIQTRHFDAVQKPRAGLLVTLAAHWRVRYFVFVSSEISFEKLVWVRIQHAKRIRTVAERMKLQPQKQDAPCLLLQVETLYWSDLFKVDHSFFFVKKIWVFPIMTVLTQKLKFP